MHILVAEDNFVNQKLSQRILSRLGCTVTIVRDGQQALNYLAEDPSISPRPDIILMDLAMPVMDGFQATHIIRTQPPFTTDPQISSTPIIGLTVPGTPYARETYLARGMDDILCKPLRVSRLTGMLRWWSNRRVLPRGVGDRMPVVVMRSEWGSHLWRAYGGPRSLI